MINFLPINNRSKLLAFFAWAGGDNNWSLTYMILCHMQCILHFCRKAYLSRHQMSSMSCTTYLSRYVFHLSYCHFFPNAKLTSSKMKKLKKKPLVYKKKTPSSWCNFHAFLSAVNGNGFEANTGLEIGNFWKKSNSRKLKTQAKKSNSSRKLKA